MIEMRFGRQVTGDLGAAAAREWLVGDGLGGFAMGTVAGLRTRGQFPQLSTGFN